MANRDAAGPSTRSVHAGRVRDPESGAIATPIHLGSTYFARSTHDLVEYLEGRQPANFYARYSNPTVDAAERKIADLEGGERALCFGSGMAAISTLLLAQLGAGDQVVATRELYGGTFEFVDRFLPRWGITATFVPPGDLKALEQAVGPKTRLIYTESPTNPKMSVVDLRGVAEIARRRGVPCAVDNTFASPLNQRPIGLGFDFVVHSATKYLGGHCDLVGGVVVGPRDRMKEVWHHRKLLGGILDPHSAYLLERGIKTLALRMERHNANGLAVARFLVQHPRVRRVYYPGLPEHPGHEIAARQMSGFGGVLAFEVEGDRAATIRVVDALEVAYLAPSLGGVESLVSQPAMTSHYFLDPGERAAQGISDSLVRVALGIEDAADLIRDLDHALETLS
ncbi:MAG TPA: PLP-dependent aspartate aminotransferase family protein [Candidatus Polarisedimenticolia bacterium]|nr:PLP-dependent aspartate aminotransferase family protein [Candidatus Polarisedimenticolia bacterium]